jgi:hypothetical protein
MIFWSLVLLVQGEKEIGGEVATPEDKKPSK